MGMAAILVMCRTSCDLIVFSSYEKACIQNLAENGPLLSEKSQFQFSCVNNLGPRSRNNLDLKLSHYFELYVCTYHFPGHRLQLFRSFHIL